MKNNIKKILAMLLVFSLLLSIVGCSVNSEKLREKVVAKIGDEEITRGEVDDYAKFSLISYYASYGEIIPLDDPNVLLLKEDILDGLIEVSLYEKTAEKYPYTVDEEEVKEEADATVASMKEALGEDGFLYILTEYELTEESFTVIANDFIRLSLSLSAFNESFTGEVTGGEEYILNTFMIANEQEIPSYIFYYYLIQEELAYQAMGQTFPTDEDEVEDLYDGIKEDIALNAAFIEEAKETGIEITEEEIEEEIGIISYIADMFGEENLQLISDAYCITYEQYKEGERWAATASLYKTKVSDSIMEEITISDRDIEKRFEENLDTYDNSTVSAMHILAEDITTANKIYDSVTASENKGKFEDLMYAYSGQEGILEAADLGPFKYETMVEEFSEVAFSMEIGDISQPVETEFGYHVIYLYDESKLPEPTLDDYYDVVKQELLYEEEDEAMEDIEKSFSKKVDFEELVNIKHPYDMLIEQLREEYDVKEYHRNLD